MNQRLIPLLTFVIGLAAGAAGSRMMRHHKRRPDPERIVMKISRDLGLDEAQKTKAREIVLDERSKVKALHEKTRGEMDGFRKELADRLEAILRPEQKPKLEALKQRWEERRKRRESKL